MDRDPVATGWNPRLQHQSGEPLEIQLSAVDRGMPTGNVGDAKPEHLGSGQNR